MYAPASVAFWMFLFGRWGSYMFFKDNLERVYASLPLPYRDIAKARLGTGIVLWFSLIGMVLISYMFFTDILLNNKLWAFLFINGLALTVNAFIYVWHDFIFIKPGKYRKAVSYAFYFPVAFLIIGLVYFTTSATFTVFGELQTDLRGYAFTSLSAIVTNTIGLGMTILSYYMYQHRYSYLRSEFGLKSNIRVKSEDIS